MDDYVMVENYEYCFADGRRIFGVFADLPDDEDGCNCSSWRQRRKDFTREPDLTDSLVFHYGGTLMPDGEIKKIYNRDDVDMFDNDRDRTGIPGLGFDGYSIMKGKGVGVTGDVGGKIKEGTERKRVKEIESGDPGWKETNGMGTKILEKMGYKRGRSVKNEQDIVAPIEAIEAKVTQFNDLKEIGSVKLPAALPPPTEEEKTEDLVVAAVGVTQSEQAANMSNKKEVYAYVTAEDFLSTKHELWVLTNLERLNLNMTELEIEKTDRELKNERENSISLMKEKGSLNMESSRKKHLGSRMEVMAVLGRLIQEKAAGTLTLESLEKCFHHLQIRFPDDYKLRKLSCIACTLSLPLFARVFQGWDPLRDPFHAVELVTSWKILLEGDNNGICDVDSSYARLISDVVLPAVILSGSNTWEPRDPEPMLRFLESWEKLLPSSILQNILDHTVLPKLSTAINTWDPRRETVPIHVWVHPWLLMLGHKLEVEGMFQLILMKLSTVLEAWHPSDASAHAILSPWKTVFDSNSWVQLMRRSIVPKLQIALEEFQMNTSNQRLDQFNWVMAWVSLIPDFLMVDLLEKFFFPRWLQGLYDWFSGNPDLSEVQKWYTGWKDLPPELLASKNIRYQLGIALNMMEQAFEGNSIDKPGLQRNLRYIQATEQGQCVNLPSVGGQSNGSTSVGGRVVKHA